MWWHFLDYAERDGRQPGVLLNRGWWLNETPRLMPVCRLFGHKPVVDGYGPHPRGLDARRWVACDRCGVRPDPQGDLDPDAWAIGQRYDGPFLEEPEPFVLTTEMLRTAGARGLTSYSVPGPWPKRPTGTVGGQVMLGRWGGGHTIGLDISPEGGDHALAFHIAISPLFWFSVHFDDHGRWLTRRLLPRDSFDTRQIGLSFDEWHLRWKLWKRQGHWSRDDPKWWAGTINLDLVEKLFGPKRFSRKQAAGPELAWVHLPHGDSYQMQLTLQRVRLGRPRLRRAKWSWQVEWQSDSAVPIHGTSGGGDFDGFVKVPDDAVTEDRWVTKACELIAKDLTERRERYGYRAEGAEE